MGARSLAGRWSPRPAAAVARAHLLLVAALLGVAALAWGVTHTRMDGMAHAPTTQLGSVAFFLVSWVVMMVAMMLPSVAPMVVTHARIRARRDPGSPGGTAALVSGYLAAWTAYGLAAYGLVTAGRAWLPALDWDGGGHVVAGGLLVGAAIYQLTPAKERCLGRCRSPFDFFLEEWREGRVGAAVMGLRHGGFCVGCCWALMVALFALGVMSVGWMAFIAAVIAAEKLLPRSRLTATCVALLLACLGLVVAFAPGAVPGFAAGAGGGHGMH